MSRIVRIGGLLALMLAMTAGLFAPKAEAATGGTLYVHLRGCYTGDYNVYEDCHDTGIPGVPITVGGLTLTTDGSGNAGWSLPAGNYNIVGPADVVAATLGIYCSYAEDLGMETYIDFTTGVLPVADGDVIYCDIYVHLGDAPKKGDDGGKKHDGGTEMPDTGIGAAAAAGSLLPLALSGAAAAGLGLGVRRRKA